jgi:hypothetical protein
MTCPEVAQSACAGLVYLHDKYSMEIIHRNKGEKALANILVTIISQTSWMQ